MELSEHFSLQEFITSNTATRKGIDNTPSSEVVENLRELCTQVLEPLRDHVKKPIKVTSGYRSEKLNKLIGGSKNSQHLEGKAADIQVTGMSVEELFSLAKEYLDYDQIIQEFDSWVHISYNGKKNRKQALRAVKKNGKTVYISEV